MNFLNRETDVQTNIIFMRFDSLPLRGLTKKVLARSRPTFENTRDDIAHAAGRSLIKRVSKFGLVL